MYNNLCVNNAKLIILKYRVFATFYYEEYPWE